MGAASPAERMRGRRGRGFGRWPPYGAVLLTALYLIVLGWLPAYFGHQACRPAARGEMSRFHAGLDWINCHLRFPPQDRTLEAYAAWLTAAFASVAAYWAWQSFRGVSEQVEEQRRATFLGMVSPIYEQRLSIAIERIARRIGIHNPAFAGELTTGTAMEALAFLQAWEQTDSVAARRWVETSHEVDQFLSIADTYIRGFDESGVGVEPWALWPQLLAQIRALRGPDWPAAQTVVSARLGPRT